MTIFSTSWLRKGWASVERRVNRADTVLKILLTSTSQYIPQLLSTFETDDAFYMALNFIPGGDIYHHLSTNDAMMSDDGNRFYAAQICQAIRYLHSMSVIYRNLKPESVMICQRGDIKLIDFSISKVWLLYPHLLAVAS